MNLSTRFGSALAALPAAVRARLDGDSDLDWVSLADRTTAFRIDKATRTPARLPPAVEALSVRLVADVGIAPADVVSGVQGRGIAGTWLTAVAVEPDGEHYRLRSKRSGELLPGVRPAALAGYVVLGLELATAMQHASEAWARASDRAQAIPEGSRDGLTQCAVQMFRALQVFPETVSRPPSTLALARSMEDAWNAQTLQVREALARWEFPHPWGTCAPGADYYAVESGYRLRAFDIAEARWLQALAEHAASGAWSSAGDGPAEAEPELSPPEQIRAGPGISPGSGRPHSSDRGDGSGPGESLDGDGAATANEDGEAGGAPVHLERDAGPAPDDPSPDQTLTSGSAPADEVPGNSSGKRPDPGVRDTPERHAAVGTVPEQPAPALVSGGTTEASGSLFFGAAGEARPPQAEIDLLVQAAQRLPAAVTRRLGEAYGDSVVKVLGRLQDPDGIRELRDTLGMVSGGNTVPGWMEELAAGLLLDTGAQTRDGQRTGPARLDPERLAEGHRVSDVTSSATGILRAIDVIEQVRLGLDFASDTWSALTLLRDAGKEAEWTLHDAAVKQARLTHDERTKLETVQRIEHELQRIRRTRADGSSSPLSALEEAALVASVLKSLQPSELVGLPADVGVPNPHDPDDIARVVAAAEALHGDVRKIANRLITVWVGDGPVVREAQGG